jgi:hypothetical protein
VPRGGRALHAARARGSTLSACTAFRVRARGAPQDAPLRSPVVRRAHGAAVRAHCVR